MKKFAIQHLYLAGFLVLIFITSFGIGLSILITKWRNYEGLDAGYFILFMMGASLLLGVFAGLFAALFLEKRKISWLKALNF